MEAILQVPSAVLVLWVWRARKGLDRSGDAPAVPRRVHLVAPVPPDELLIWSASADALVMPSSRRRSITTTTRRSCSSMAAGVPVVASTCRDGPIVQARARASCDPTSPASIAAAISSIVTASPRIAWRCVDALRAAPTDTTGRRSWTPCSVPTRLLPRPDDRPGADRRAEAKSIDSSATWPNRRSSSQRRSRARTPDRQAPEDQDQLTPCGPAGRTDQPRCGPLSSADRSHPQASGDPPSSGARRSPPDPLHTSTTRRRRARPRPARHDRAGGGADRRAGQRIAQNLGRRRPAGVRSDPQPRRQGTSIALPRGTRLDGIPQRRDHRGRQRVTDGSELASPDSLSDAGHSE